MRVGWWLVSVGSGCAGAGAGSGAVAGVCGLLGSVCLFVFCFFLLFQIFFLRFLFRSKIELPSNEEPLLLMNDGILHAMLSY